MDFNTAVRTCLREKFADFQGRARRAEFWWFTLFSLVGGLVTSIIDSALGTGSFDGGLFNLLFSLAILIPSLAVSVRRLHDIDRTGWWLLLVLVPIVGWIVLLVFNVLPGTVGPNRFGADPINGEDHPRPMDRGGPSEFDDIMDDSYRKSRIPSVDRDD